MNNRTICPPGQCLILEPSFITIQCGGFWFIMEENHIIFCYTDPVSFLFIFFPLFVDSNIDFNVQVYK